MTLQWTAELAAKTPPFRGDGAPIKPSKKSLDNKFLGPVATSLAPLRAPNYRPRKSLVTLAETGEGSFADEADALIILGGTGTKGPHKGSITMTTDDEIRKVTERAVDRWVHKYGVADAVEIFGLVGAWKPYDLMSSPNRTMRSCRERMRQHLAHTADYDAALARAQQLLADSGLKAYRGDQYDGSAESLAYLFPDHAPFFEVATAALGRANERSRCLGGAITSMERYHAVAKQLGNTDLEDNALVIPRSLREAGLAPLLEQAADKPGNVGIARALTAYCSPEAASALATFADVKACHATLTAYFKQHPALAKAALAPLANGADKSLRKAAEKILAAATA